MRGKAPAMGKDKDSGIVHDPDKLIREVSGKNAADATKQEAADTILEVVRRANDGTLPSGGSY
jgi:hypothetical protein